MSLLWEKLVRPMLFRLDAERAHELGVSALKCGLASPFYADPASFGNTAIERFGLKFANPLGLAAGFDKNGVVVEQLASLAFGFVEVGTVTFRPQPGNPKPRVFRLPNDGALINRLGFNNDGAEAVSRRLAAIRRRCVIGVNIGRNKDVPNEEAVENYLASFDLVHPVADYVAVNVSSPNTPGLRDLQHAKSLNELLAALAKRNSELGAKPLLVKISPDLDDDGILEVTDVCLTQRIDGMIATNTTVNRKGRSDSAMDPGPGGLSGRPLAARSNYVISMIYRHTAGRMPIIGVGGVFTGHDAFEKIAAGASLVQAYTGFVYGGPSFPRQLNKGLVQKLREHGFTSVDQAVGSAAGAV